jgi:hypothetical protein
MPGLLFPIVCAAPLSKEVSASFQIRFQAYRWFCFDTLSALQLTDRFIEENEVDDEAGHMVFVDTVDVYYSEIAKMPTKEDSNPNSPFIGKAPEECYQLLIKLREDTESKIDIERFILMDERSTTDDTVLLVNTFLEQDHETRGMETLRASFGISGLAIVLYESGHSSVEEDADRAKLEQDGVYRG